MTKPERTRLMLWLGILAVLIIIAYVVNSGGSKTITGSSAIGPYEPIAVENPNLRLDLIAGSQKVEYSGRHRNIFMETAPPPLVPAVQKPQALTPAQIAAQDPNYKPPPPPIVVNYKFYGYVDDTHGGTRRAFFTNGEEVVIAGVGDTLENRLRVVRIGNDSVELEEISSLRHTTVNIEPDVATP